MEPEKEIRWVGSAYQDLLAFAQDVRREAGFQLGKVQCGLEPDDWKPLSAVYVLHCFQKKDERMSRTDKAIAEARYRAVARTRA